MLINCKHCNTSFYISPSRVGRTKYCSKTCMLKNKHKDPRYCELCNDKLGFTAQWDHKRNIKYCRTCFTKDLSYKEKIIGGWFKEGSIPWNKGLKGFMAGEKNANWKGGKYTSERHKAMKQLEYIEWRKKIFERDDYTCRNCGERGGKINADHIKKWSLHPELRLDLNNGQTLCKDCHLEKTQKDVEDFG